MDWSSDYQWGWFVGYLSVADDGGDATKSATQPQRGSKRSRVRGWTLKARLMLPTVMTNVRSKELDWPVENLGLTGQNHAFQPCEFSVARYYQRHDSIYDIQFIRREIA